MTDLRQSKNLCRLDVRGVRGRKATGAQPCRRRFGGCQSLRGLEGAAQVLNELVGFGEELAAHVADLIVNRFQRNLERHHPRKKMLEGGAREAARYRKKEQPKKKPRERSAHAEAAVK